MRLPRKVLLKKIRKIGPLNMIIFLLAAICFLLAILCLVLLTFPFVWYNMKKEISVQQDPLDLEKSGSERNG